MVNGKKYKKHSTKTKQLRFTNKLTDTFLESSNDEDKGNVIQYICNCETELELY